MADEKVFISRCETYDPDLLRRKIEQAFGAFGGAGRYAGRGTKVLLKPNMLSGEPPEKAITTHPAVVEAVARMFIDAGARVTIGDSPGIGRAAKVAEKTGIAEVARRLGIKVVDFDDSVLLKAPADFMFKKIEIARAVIEADVMINLPKFKSHGQMIMTAAVKNLFGCIVGPRKAQWHMAAGRDRDAFARLLLELSLLVAPRFSLIDGIIGMDGNGPSAGRTRPVNLILAGEDPLAVDRIAAAVAGLKEEDYPLMRTARAMPAFAERFGRIEVVGDALESVALHDFQLPPGQDLRFGPRTLRRLLKRAVAARPVINRRKCKACGICAQHCPPEAISTSGGRVLIDRSACISCFCCQEMCPQHAIDIRRGWLARLLIRRKGQ